MEKATDYKKCLVQKGNAVKRLAKDFAYYAQDAEKAEAKLKEAKEQNSDEASIQRHTNNVSECTGAKKYTFTSLVKFTAELEELLIRIDTNNQDEEAQKAKDEAKALTEYSNAKNYLEDAKKLLEAENAVRSAK